MQSRWLSGIFVILLAYWTRANPILSHPKVATEFIILHNNDMHARFDQTSVNSGTCPPEDVHTNKCYGGFARVAHEVRKYRKEAQEGGTSVLYLNAGDTYTGTSWFTIFKDKIASAFLNKLKPDAISLGNHEFDERVEGLIPFLNEVTFPVLACNLDLSKVPQLKATKHLAHSAILETNGTKVGVIGYLTPDTKKLTLNMDVEFNEEVESINIEAKKLKAQGIKIIIALGHSGYLKDLEIAKNCPEVDIVIGGHTNTFLYTGAQPDAEHIDGPYPTMVKQNGGKEVPVVQAYAYTKYLGKLHVQFDADGNLIKWDGSPILLNASVAQEQDLLDLLEVFRPNVTRLEKSVVGHTKVHLEGNKAVCRAEECNLGNLIADAMVFSRLMEEQGGDFWTDAAISIMQGGGIRSSIEKRSDGAITDNDILSVLPWSNKLYMVSMKGSSIRRALEHGAALRGKDSDGGFLQVSGIRVVFNSNKPEGQRVVSVQVRCAACRVPSYSDLKDTSIYNVVLGEFLLDGGDGHVIRESGHQPQRLQNNNLEAVSQYLSHRDYVYPEIEGRIIFINSTNAIMGSAALLLISSLLIKIIA
ncbi:protein 5NUC [Drosophila sechellia]|uniref:5'-nucleotidase n=1 Tax=Drosophila sechellia TaxID=7238 RepID=B4HMU5_DROSE|nr:protein 5NUC [Drosophila sechellia]XP_032573047.1 protein 5NUC [Drosophila sechellia]XP_032573049.1 protein 5NUC [Drosophila sechellia]XP_032573050.1 protein 5NUC [Drosophila sechellia]EDW48295.1 GM21782 [Drosophila sechellia]